MRCVICYIVIKQEKKITKSPLQWQCEGHRELKNKANLPQVSSHDIELIS